jgi:hypothetical protein
MLVYDIESSGYQEGSVYFMGPGKKYVIKFQYHNTERSARAYLRTLAWYQHKDFTNIVDILDFGYVGQGKENYGTSYYYTWHVMPRLDETREYLNEDDLIEKLKWAGIRAADVRQDNYGWDGKKRCKLFDIEPEYVTPRIPRSFKHAKSNRKTARKISKMAA